ncbi:MAG: tRNA threonylcarbamoyladenosine dehydratase [Desulfobulbaceae bacterium]|nr:tRNA threonylcarbamoyladenosine dehydratase [Desulfobulbaceae bacterium]
MDRFLRIERLLGPEAFARLRDNVVTIAGLGAVGGHAMEGLARAGINRIRLVDFDVVRTHNINRQIIALESTVGTQKVIAARDRILQINPAAQVEIMPTFIDQHSVGTILDPKPDLLIDAIDMVGPKVELLAAAFARGIPIISSMGAALRTDPSQIKLADLMQTKKCPLARRIRRRLRLRGIERGIPCVFSTEPVDFTYEEPEQEVGNEHLLPHQPSPRRVLGSLPTLTGIFGLIIANQAIRQLSGLQYKS